MKVELYGHQCWFGSNHIQNFLCCCMLSCVMRTKGVVLAGFNPHPKVAHSSHIVSLLRKFSKQNIIAFMQFSSEGRIFFLLLRNMPFCGKLSSQRPRDPLQTKFECSWAVYRHPIYRGPLKPKTFLAFYLDAKGMTK